MSVIACGRQTSVTAGTVMHRTKLSLTIWFWAAHLMATHSNGMSAQQSKGQLGLSYSTAWLLAQKLSVDGGPRSANHWKASSRSTRPRCRSFARDNSFFEITKTGKMIVIGAVEVINHATGKAQKPKALGRKYLDTLSGRIRLAAIPGNRSPYPCLHQGQHCARRDTDYGRPRILSRPGRLPARSPRRRQHGGAHPPQVDPSGVRSPKALEPRDLSRSSPATPRHLPQRIRLPLQPSLLSACVLRDDPWSGDPPFSGLLLGHHRPTEPAQGRCDTAKEFPSPQDRGGNATGRRGPRQTCRFAPRYWRSVASLVIPGTTR